MIKGITKREREVTDPQKIRYILDTAKLLHLGMLDGDEPYVIPMNYGYTMEAGALTLYLHGATKGRKLDVLRVNPKVFFSLECDIVPFEGPYRADEDPDRQGLHLHRKACKHRQRHPHPGIQLHRQAAPPAGAAGNDAKQGIKQEKERAARRATRSYFFYFLPLR